MFRNMLGLALFVALATSSLACDREDRTVVQAISDRAFALDYEEINESETEVYLWTTSLDEAQIRLRLRGFVDGTIRVQVLDATGFPIFDAEFYESDHHFFESDEESLLAFTPPAVPGQWTIRTDTHDFTGHLYLNIDEL